MVYCNFPIDFEKNIYETAIEIINSQNWSSTVISIFVKGN